MSEKKKTDTKTPKDASTLFHSIIKASVKEGEKKAKKPNKDKK